MVKEKFSNNINVKRFNIILIAILNSCSDDSNLHKVPVPCFQNSDYTLLGKHCDWNGAVAKTSTGSCDLGTFVCKSENVICVGAVYPTLEACDYRDNDCDGKIDNLVDAPLELCYEGIPETAIHPPCRAGIKMCKRGHWKCEGQILPGSRDICADLIDNDCNGIIDDSTEPDEDRRYDIILIVDRSGSMGQYMLDIKTTLLSASVLDTNFYKIWLFDLPLTNGDIYGPNVKCHGLDPTYPLRSCEFNDLILAADEIDASHGATELSYDILYDIATNRIQFDWTKDAARYVLLFADEDGQTQNSITESQVSLLYKDIHFIGFVVESNDFDDIGQIFDLEAVDINEQFEKNVINICR